MVTQAKAPHRAVILLNIEIHEVLPTNECSGKLVSISELKDAGIKPKMVISISGFDRQDCLKKLKAWMDNARN